MRGKKFIFLTVLFLFWFVIFFSYGNQETGRKGEIEKEDGLKVINNPSQPMYGKIVFDLGKVSVLGAEKNENHIFASIWEVQADTQGNVYVSDIKDRRIKKFNSGGEYLYDIGRMGQGPGEFQSPRNIFVDDKTGDFYAADFMKVHRYDKNGTFQETVAINRIFHTFFVDDDQSFWAQTSYMDESGQGEAFEKISPQGELTRRIHKFSPQLADPSKPSGEGEVTSVAAPKHGYEQKLIISRVDEKTFLWALSNQYELNVIDIKGDLLFRTRKQEDPQGFSGKEKEEILDRFNPNARKMVKLPQFKPFFLNIISDDLGRIYLQKTRSPVSGKEEYVYDIFSRSGYYLYESRFSEIPAVIKNGFFYAVVRDPGTDIQYVKIYEIKNWDLIKEDIS